MSLSNGAQKIYGMCGRASPGKLSGLAVKGGCDTDTSTIVNTKTIKYMPT